MSHEIDEALDNLRSAVARVRGPRGRDSIRPMKYGFFLDALDAGREHLAVTDLQAMLDLAIESEKAQLRKMADTAEAIGRHNARLGVTK